MIWNKKLPEWRASGTEPPESLKEEGFTAGYKPPAPYFNWLFHTIYEAVQEIRNALKEVAVTGKAADLQEDSEHRLVSDTEKTAWNGKASADHTHNNMTAATQNTAGKAGLVPAPAKGNADRYLRSDGTWQKPPNDNTTYGNMTAASASAAGKAGLVPAPAAGAQGKYLRGDGTWQTPPDTNTTYSAATQSAAGLMSAADKKKLDGVAEKANNYSHPSTHAATMISQDSTHRFVTDAEKQTWNGKANASHSHNYAGAASAGGSATSADKAAKLSTARTITIGNKGKSFDGSANVSFTLKEIGAFANKNSGISSSGQDFNSFIVPGFYEVGIDGNFEFGNVKNGPKLSPWGFLLVFSNDWVFLQIYIPSKTNEQVPLSLCRYMPRKIAGSSADIYPNYTNVTVKEAEMQHPTMAIRSKWGTGASAVWTEWRYVWGSAWDGRGVFGKTE